MLPLAQYPKTNQPARQLSPEEVAEAIRMYEAVKATDMKANEPKHYEQPMVSAKTAEAFGLFFAPVGRIGRNMWWGTLLATIVFSLVIKIITDSINDKSMVFILLASIGAVFVSRIMVDIKRLHDIGAPGWWASAPWVMFAGFLVSAFDLAKSAEVNSIRTFETGAGNLVAFGVFSMMSSLMLAVVCAFMPGQPHDNQYGKAPE
jgi:uncharacterized membrane protein YhaH (DUF805 family)